MKIRLLLYIILGIISATIATNLRLLPYSNRELILKKKLSEDIVYQNIKKEVAKKIEQAQPALNQTQKDKLVEITTSSILRNQKDIVSQNIASTSSKLENVDINKIFKHYLMAVDSFYYLGLTRNITETARLSDSIKAGQYYNPLMMAPLGCWYYFDLHPFVGFYVYKVLQFFKKDISLEDGVACTSIFLVIIALIAFLFFNYKLDIKPLPSFIGSVFMLSMPIFFQRSILGWYDTDPYNCIFPILIIGSLLLALDPEIRKRDRVIYCLSASFFTGLYPLFWNGWTFIFASAFLLVVLTITIGALAYRSFKIIKEHLLLISLYILLSLIAIIVFRGWDGFIFSVHDTFLRIARFANRELNLSWPDAFLMVDELKKMTLIKIIIFCGGRLFFFSSVVSLIILFFSKKRIDGKSYPELNKAMLLLSFFIITLLMATHAERFSVLLVGPLAFLFTFLIDRLQKSVLKRPGMTLRIFVNLALLSLIILPTRTSFLLTKVKQPMIYNDTWNSAMTTLNSDTTKNSIVNTWWSPGHFITAMARRRVTFDGATLEKPVGYWMARVFISNDEKEALGILRMLNLSGNSACEFLIKNGFELSNSISIINSIILKSKTEALQFLNNYLNKDDAKSLLQFTHGDPPESYILIYNDLIEKTLALSFMGNWDFKKASDFLKLKERNPKSALALIKENYGNNYIKFLWEISGGPQYYEKASDEVKREGNVIYFKNNVWVNLLTKECDLADIKSPFHNKISQILYIEEGKLKTKVLNNTSRLAVMLLEDANKYRIVLADKRLCNSMIFRLFYLNGLGLDRLMPFITENNPQEDTSIKVFKIDWKEIRNE